VRPRPALTWLLTLSLLLQWGTAFGHCLRLAAPAEALHLEICTVEGLKTVALSADDQQEPEGAKSPLATPAVCPACAGPAAPALPTPTVTAAPPLLLAQAPEAPQPPPAPAPAPPRGCQPPPRAPPTS
jgi:hypothetical protein